MIFGYPFTPSEIWSLPILTVLVRSAGRHVVQSLIVHQSPCDCSPFATVCAVPLGAAVKSLSRHGQRSSCWAARHFMVQPQWVRLPHLINLKRGAYIVPYGDEW